MGTTGYLHNNDSCRQSAPPVANIVVNRFLFERLGRIVDSFFFFFLIGLATKLVFCIFFSFPPRPLSRFFLFFS